MSQLRRMIVLRELAPGQHLAETALAEQFGVSRGPVRDALRGLETEGLVQTISNRVHVRGFSEKDIRALYRLRRAIEVLAVEDVVALRDGVDWTPLRTSVEIMKRAADDGDTGRFAAADQDFHDGLYRVTDNHHLVRVWSTIRPTVEVLVEITTARDTDLHPSSESHKDLLTLLRTGDRDAIVSELNIHLQGSLNRMIASHEERVLADIEETR